MMGHAHAENREHARVLHANHAAAHNNQRAGQRLQIENLVAVDNCAAIDGHLG